MRPWILLIVSLAALTACGQAGGDKDAAPPGSEPQPVPAPAPPAPPPGEPAAQAFVGTWAANPGLCATGAWEVRADGLSTAGEVSCSWDPAAVQHTAAGWTVDARCTAEGEETSPRLTFTGDADSLAIAGGPFASVPLVRCPAAPQG